MVIERKTPVVYLNNVPIQKAQNNNMAPVTGNKNFVGRSNWDNDCLYSGLQIAVPLNPKSSYFFLPRLRFHWQNRRTSHVANSIYL